MATIPSTTNQLRHVRKTINFDGGANNGNLGDEVPVFTTTGRVLVEKGFVYCSDALVSSAPDETNIALFAGGASLGLDPVLLTGVATGLWLTQDVNGWDYWGRDIGRGFGQPAVSTNITLKVDQDVTGADITDGTLIIDIWYYPVSDDGALAGDDINAGYMPADVKAWLATAAATPTVAGVPEVDLTHIGGTAVTAAAGIPEVKVASIANNAVTAAAIATDAIDADALAADAVTEIWNKAMSDLAAVPGATASALAALNWLFELARNKLTQTATTGTVLKDDGSTALATTTVSDDGVTFTRGEWT